MNRAGETTYIPLGKPKGGVCSYVSRMKCTLSVARAENQLFAVIHESMSLPAALFTCQHCAKTWASSVLIGKFSVLSLTDTKFVGNIFDKIADIVKVLNSDNAATAYTLNEVELEL